MFKAKLIENQGYYNLKNKQFWLIFLPAFPIAFISNFFVHSVWVTCLAVICYITFIIFISKNKILLDSFINKHIIEIDKKEIRIKTQKGNTQETYKIADLEKIVLQKEYAIPQETMKDIAAEFSGNTRKNFIIIQQENKNHQFDFEIDSHYMIKQLDKIKKVWNQNGLKLEEI